MICFRRVKRKAYQLINVHQTGSVRPLANCSIKFRTPPEARVRYTNRPGYPIIDYIRPVCLGGCINFGNTTSAASRAAAGKFISYPRVAVRVSTTRDSLRHAVFVMHSHVVVLIQKLSRSNKPIITLLLRLTMVVKIVA